MAIYTLSLVTTDLDDRGLAYTAKRSGVSVQAMLDTALKDFVTGLHANYLGALSVNVNAVLTADTTKVAAVAAAAGVVLDKDGLPT